MWGSGDQIQVLKFSRQAISSLHLRHLLPHLEVAPSSHPSTPSTVPVENTQQELQGDSDRAAVLKGFTVTGTIKYDSRPRAGLGRGCGCSVICGIGVKPSMKSYSRCVLTSERKRICQVNKRGQEGLAVLAEEPA